MNYRHISFFSLAIALILPAQAVRATPINEQVNHQVNPSPPISQAAKDLILSPADTQEKSVSPGKIKTDKTALRNLFRDQPVNATVTNQLKLVIKLGDRRVYLYKNETLLNSYPIAVGKDGWETPVGNHKIMQKIVQPAWQHPFTGEVIPPGPDNPLGERWIGFWTDGKNYIGFHGTPDEHTVGTAASHGCIRMLNQDVLKLFEQVAIGTPVSVVP
ncbi:MAG: L,D-transpeptidase [Microcoleaceae cyanobacterium]